VVADVVAGKVVMRMTRKATITARVGGESRRIPACGEPAPQPGTGWSTLAWTSAEDSGGIAAVVPFLLLRRHLAQSRIAALMLVLMVAVVGVVVGDTMGGSDAASWRVTGGVVREVTGGVVRDWGGNCCRYSSRNWHAFSSVFLCHGVRESSDSGGPAAARNGSPCLCLRHLMMAPTLAATVQQTPMAAIRSVAVLEWGLLLRPTSQSWAWTGLM
ncbi:hypothetical protein CYMTET_29405, partial [Cymbomonas tetramitiformis]